MSALELVCGGGPATVDGVAGAGDEGGLFGEQPRRQPRHLLRRASPADVLVCLGVLLDLLRGGVGAEEGGGNDARPDGVHTDPCRRRYSTLSAPIMGRCNRDL